MRTPRRTLALASVAAAALAAAAPAALGGTTQESIFQDDQPTGLGSPRTPQILDELKDLGVDTVHTVVLWRNLSPAYNKTRKPKFDSDHPRGYNSGEWDKLDLIVTEASRRGLEVLLTPSGPGPRWASRCRKKTSTCDPNPKYFKDFVEAVGRRYSGSFMDENQLRLPLPRVRRWSVWNEPNQGGWLTPQYSGRTPRAPHLYRSLFIAADKGLRSAGHSRSQLLLGETAPIGRTTGRALTRPVAPGLFYRELFCLDSRGRKLSSSQRRSRKCPSRFKLGADGVAHHPYNRAGVGKPTGSAPRDHISIGQLSRLRTVLKQGSRARRIRSNAPIYLTEMGWQTNPPDRRFGLSLTRAAEYLNQTDWIAYNDKQVRGVGQFLLVDPSNDALFQTGLRQPDGTPKPSYDAYRLPIWVVKRGSQVRVWGEVRPGGSGEVVNVQNNAGGSFKTVHTLTTGNPRGYFSVNLPNPGGRWRIEWRGRTSREAGVARR